MTDLGAAIEAGARRLSSMSDRGARLAAFLAGVMLTLAHAPLFLFPAAFLAFPVFILLIDRSKDWWDAARYGWWFGFGHFLSGLYWVGIAFTARGDMPPGSGALASVMLAIALAYFPAIAAAGARRFWRSGWRRILVFAVAFCLMEWLRGHIFTGFPWNLPANIWGFSNVLMQPLALIGSYGYSLVTVLIAAAPVALADGAATTRARLAPSALALAALLSIALGGALRLGGAQPGHFEGPVLRLVQANIPQREKWASGKLADNLYRHLEMSRRDWSGRPYAAVTHVVWPETAVPYFIDTQPSKRHLIAHSLDNQVALITGARRIERPAGGVRLFNSILAMDSEGAILARYDKSHLVPFGEYLPLRDLLGRLGFGSLVQETIDFSEGPGLLSMDLPGLPAAGPLICYEIIFPGRVAADGDAEARPGWLLNLTNDAWYGRSSGPYQHFLMSRYRAVEEGLPVVRAAGTGISGIIDAYGRVEASLPLQAAGVIDSPIPRPLATETLYARVGDLLFWLLLVAAGAAVAAVPGRRK